jgi:hypothetical protein
VSAPSKIIVELTGKTIAVHFTGHVTLISEDTALVLADALKQVAYGEKKRLTVYEESETRPAGIYA